MGSSKFNRNIDGGVMVDRNSSGVYRIATDSGNADISSSAPNWTINGSGSVSTSGSGSTVTILGTGQLSADKGGQIFDDFFALGSGASADTPYFIKSNLSAASASYQGHPGVLAHTGGSPSYAVTNPSFEIQGAEWEYEAVVQMGAVPGGSYSFVAGFFNSTTIGSITHGVYFLISGASANFQMATRDAVGVGSTTTATASAVGATTWYRLGININSASSLATFYVDGSSVGTVNTNLPQFSGAVGNRLMTGVIFSAPGGGSALSDYVFTKWTLNTPR